MINKGKQKQIHIDLKCSRKVSCIYIVIRKAIITYLILCLSLYSPAQEGIRWTRLSGWQEVIEQAKKENKYIYVDCYATWCAPCRKMDENTFSNKEVGELFNDKFISVKIQMDSTKNDKDFVKGWYKDAVKIKKEHYVFSYPTSLFFNPQGELIEKSTGYKKENSLINIALASLKPGKKYENPNREFYDLLKKYTNGIYEYQFFPYMITTAKKIGQSELATKLIHDYHQHLLTLTNNELLNAKYIEFIAEYGYVDNENSDKNLSKMFYPNEKKVDALMREAHYSKMALNEMIRRGYVQKFIEEIAEREKGFVQSILNGKSKKDSNKIGYTAPDSGIVWDTLYKNIAAKFSDDIAQMNVLWAKIKYYDFYKDEKAKTYFIILTKKYGIEALQSKQGLRDQFINYMAWYYGVMSGKDINENVYLANLLHEAIKRKEQRMLPGECRPFFYIDTYARLLYKIGKKEKAIKEEKEALNIYLNCSGGKIGDERYVFYSNAIKQMENDEELTNR